MRLSNPNPQRRAISLTPLIDVVFLLLVFFMLASTFMKYSTVPIATTGSGSHPSPLDVQTMALIHIGPSDQITINGQTIERTQLASHLTRLQISGITRAIIAVRPKATVADLTKALTVVRRVPFKSIQILN